MLRCASSFGDILLLSREIEEMSGYTHRLMHLFSVLSDVHSRATTASSPHLTQHSSDHDASHAVVISSHSPSPAVSSLLSNPPPPFFFVCVGVCVGVCVCVWVFIRSS